MFAPADPIPNRTRDVAPDIGAQMVVAWHDGLNRPVEATPYDVISRPRVYPYWHPDRRKQRRAS